MLLLLLLLFREVDQRLWEPKLKGLSDYGLKKSQLFGGDMVLPKRLLKNGISDVEYRWPGYPGSARVPYVIDNSLKDAESKILAAMDEYHRHTCVRFVPRTNEEAYLYIFQGTEGCYSVVGRDRSFAQPQPVSLAPGCQNIGTIIHELGHALGFFHEQNRSDRDQFLIIHEENVMEGSLNNFRKLSPPDNLLLTPFDYDSIMIYGEYAFSKDGLSKTMEARDGHPLLNPYDKTSLTPSDIKRVRLLYKCDDLSTL